MTKKPMPLLPEPVKGRVCWSCEHVYYSNADGGYSELTPGSDFVLECSKGFWDFDAYRDTLDKFREKLLTAEQCAAFKPTVA